MRTLFILGGDFNSKHPRWGSQIANPRGRVLSDLITQFNLEVFFPLEPTYYPDSGTTPDMLDFYIGKQISQKLTNVRVLHELSSDHFPVMATLNIASQFTPVNRGLLNYPFDWERYKELMNGAYRPQNTT